ncbi:MAG: hypothetical protein V3V78_04345 [Candidatus Woesearchaeota archaeon]
MSDYIDDWIAANAKSIHNALHNERLKSLDAVSQFHLPLKSRYSLELYDFSEMHLCNVCLEIPPPDNHIVVRDGKVTSPDGKRHTHDYYYDDEMILCLTPGQFLILPDHKTSGQTMEYFLKETPELIRIVEGIFFLTGSRSEISNSLNLSYSFN